MIDIKKRCSIKGEGSTVILVHGMGGPIVWEPLADYLLDSYKVIIPIFPGYLSEDGYIEYNDDLYVNFLEELRKQLSLEKLNLVGLSMGGRTVINYALRYTNKVSKLVVIDGIGIGNMSKIFNLPIIKNILPSILRLLLQSKKNIIKLCSQDFVNKDSDVLKMTTEYFMNMMKKDNIRANFTNILIKVGVENKEWIYTLPKLSIPTLILWGSEDKTSHLEWGYQLQDLIADSKLNVSEGYGHMAVMENPQFFAQKINEFMEKE